MAPKNAQKPAEQYGRYPTLISRSALAIKLYLQKLKSKEKVPSLASRAGAQKAKTQAAVPFLTPREEFELYKWLVDEDIRIAGLREHEIECIGQTHEGADPPKASFAFAISGTRGGMKKRTGPFDAKARLAFFSSVVHERWPEQLARE